MVFIAALVSFCTFLYYLRHQKILLYGDAVAHINIARRVVDSLTPGPTQFGTVWLPLPHILMLPFVWIDRAWQTGIAGSIGSMVGYVVGTVGVYRLLSRIGSRAAAWIGAFTFAANPNLLYLQSTAMTESLYLATMVWASVWFVEFWLYTRHQRYISAGGSLLRCSFALAVACMTRYDGWFLAAVFALVVVARFFWIDRQRRRTLLKPLLAFLLVTALTPTLWLGYNYFVFENALEFAVGPHSAKGITARTTKPGDPPHPGHHDIGTASTYFIKAAKLNVGEGRLQHLLFMLAFIAAIVSCVDRRFRPALVLWMPWPFYALSIAYGSVPIFMPQWWPHSYYNVRYGIELLPAIAVFTAIAFEILRRVNWTRQYVLVAGSLVTACVIASYISIWRAVPISLREARVNSVARMAFESAVAAELYALPPGTRILMHLGSYGGALQRVAFPLQRVVHEGNNILWKEALADPAKSADLVVAVEDDPVADAVKKNHSGLETIRILHTLNGPTATLYRSSIRQH